MTPSHALSATLAIALCAVVISCSGERSADPEEVGRTAELMCEPELLPSAEDTVYLNARFVPGTTRAEVDYIVSFYQGLSVVRKRQLHNKEAYVLRAVRSTLPENVTPECIAAALVRNHPDYVLEAEVQKRSYVLEKRTEDT